jgi:hypothetical protein
MKMTTVAIGQKSHLYPDAPHRETLSLNLEARAEKVIQENSGRIIEIAV